MPVWADDQRFDISAKLPEGATQDQLPEMFQALLEHRFGLTFHREHREGSINALVVSKGGLKLQTAVPESAQPAWVASAAAARGPYGNGNIGGIRFRSISVPDSDGSPTAVWQSPAMGFVRRSSTGGRGGFGWHYEAPSITFEGLADLVAIAGNGLDPGVVDMTGMTGRYRVNLDVSMADLIEALTAAPGDRAALEDAQLRVVQDGLKKLGLQLETRKAPVDVIVIDHLEKTPTAN
jgi:uncharacterized protein (TIGR03435 family)